MKTIRFGIIGCGDVCEVKSGPAFNKVEGSALVAVMRRDRAKAADYARRHAVPRFYDDADALIADPDVDVVYVATPPGSHADYAVAAARAGKPVYVEKPMATTRAECDRMLAACTEAKVPLYVAYYRRALPRFVKVKQLLDSGAIGQVRGVTTVLTQPPAPAHLDRAALPWRVNPAIAGGGLFLDLAAHTLDLLDHLLGPITHSRGDAANLGGFYDAEDTVSASFTFPGGVLGTGYWNFVAGTRCDRTEIHGSFGRLSFATFDEAPVVLETAAGREELVIAHPPHVQQPLITQVVAALNGRGTCASTGESAARTSAVMDAVLTGYRAARPPRV